VKRKERQMRRIALALTLALPASMLLAQPAGATATRIPVTFIDTHTSSGEPARQWLSGHVFHVRGEVDTAAVTGDLQGTLTLTFGLNVDINTGNGAIAGSFVLATASVSWAGSFNGKLTADGASGRFTGQGSDGSKLLGTFVSIGPDQDLDKAVILRPHG
jgi:hypothetical protein